MSSLGFHYVWDVYNCAFDAIALVSPVEKLMDDIIQSSSLTLIDKKFNQFAPHGVTGIYLLEESHLSAHSWPENGYIALDLFSCIALDDSTKIKNIIEDHLGQVRIEERKIERGIIG